MKLVLANGVFDLLHPGHVRHLEEARRLGDYLVVGVTIDAFVGKIGRPIQTIEERMEMLRALRCVSAVSMCKDSIEALEQWKPQIFVKGHEYRKKGLKAVEIGYCAANGIQVEFTKESGLSTSKLIERIRCA